MKKTQHKDIDNSIFDDYEKQLSYQEMTDLVSDYLFKKLTPYEEKVFKQNLFRYPEIQDEVKQFYSAFSEINHSKFEQEFSQKSRNISYKVQNRLSEKRQKATLFQRVKFLLPAMTLLLIVLIPQYFISDSSFELFLVKTGLKESLVSMFPSYLKSNNSQKQGVTYSTDMGIDRQEVATADMTVNFLKQSDWLVLKQDITQDELLDFVKDVGNLLDYSLDFVDDLYDDDIETEALTLRFNQMQQGQMLNNSFDLINFNNEIYELDEQDLQKLLNNDTGL